MTRTLKLAAGKSGQRRLLVISGDKDWCFDQVGIAIQQLGDQKVLFVGNTDLSTTHEKVESSRASKLSKWLGREHKNIVFDAFSGFDVDAFGAISGALSAGGVFILLTPPLGSWFQFPDPENRRIIVYPQMESAVSGWYLKRLSLLIQSSDQLSLWCQDGQLKMQQQCSVPDSKKKSPPAPYRTFCQAKAVKAIHKVVRGHRRRPLVMTADRGRGKSAALGIAAAQLLKEGIEQILITAPTRKTADIFFQHLRNELGEEYNECLSRVDFIAPDDLVNSRPETALLLVDEAAAIPSPMLEVMLTTYSRIVYATTVHGYEGTGRGFAIRFKKTLDHQAPHWQEVRLEAPIRWTVGDSLESFVFSALLLNATPVEIGTGKTVDPGQCQFRELTPESLIHDEALLHQLFGLLVLAHYQTRPFDLRQLLDGGNISIFCLFTPDNKLVAVLLAAQEGEIESTLSEGIWLGQRRVRGHLLPQSLSNHLGLPHAITLSGMRVIRVAVHPDVQRMGLGLVLLHSFLIHAKNKGIDYLGTLFGATHDLLHFWSEAGYQPLRVGLSKDSASGTHSIMMLKPLSEDGQRFVSEAINCFLNQFRWLLMDGLQHLDAKLVEIIFRLLSAEIIQQQVPLSERDYQELLSFVKGQRQYENCIHAIKKATICILTSNVSENIDMSLLIKRVLQNQSWASVVRACNYSGEKQGRQALHDFIKVNQKYWMPLSS